MVERFDVYLVSLDDLSATAGEAKNTRPCVVVSPDEINRYIQSVIIAPLSSLDGRSYPTRIEVDFLNSKRSAVLDQIRAVDRGRLVKKVGRIESTQQAAILRCLGELFAE